MPGQETGLPKAGKLRIKLNGHVVVNRTTTGTASGSSKPASLPVPAQGIPRTHAQKGQKRTHEAGNHPSQALSVKALHPGIDSLVKEGMLIPSDLDAILRSPHGKLAASVRTSLPGPKNTTTATGGPSFTFSAARSDLLPEEACRDLPTPSLGGPPAKKQRLQALAAAVPLGSSSIAELFPLAAPIPAPAQEGEQKAVTQQQMLPSSAVATCSSAADQPTLAQAAQPVQEATSDVAAVMDAAWFGGAAPAAVPGPQPMPSPKVTKAIPPAYSSLPGRDLPVVERARAELRAAVAEREREKAAQQEAARAARQAAAHQQKQQEASSGPQDQDQKPLAQGTVGVQTKVSSEEKARWLAKIRARRPTKEQREAQEKQAQAEAALREEERQAEATRMEEQRQAEAAQREEERLAEAARLEAEARQQEADEQDRQEAVERIEKLRDTLRKYRAEGWPEWLQKGVLFEEQEERDEWVAIYKAAGQPWPAKYDVPGGCCAPKRARGAAAKQGLRAPGRRKTRSRLSGSDSDMEIDDPVLPDMPKKALYEAFKGTAALESTVAGAQAAVSGQSCGTHNGASPDAVTTSVAPPEQLHPIAAAVPQAQADLEAAAAALEADPAAKARRPSPGSSESETEGVNIPAPKLEEGELACNRQSAPQPDERPEQNTARDWRATYERRSWKRRTATRYSSERSSRETSPHRTPPGWRSRSQEGKYVRPSQARSRDARSHERDFDQRYPCSRRSAERLSHEHDSREARYRQRSPERSPSRVRHSWRERSRNERSRSRDKERARRNERSRSRSQGRDNERAHRRADEGACRPHAGSTVDEDPAELRAKMEALKSSTQHGKQYVEVALAALQRRLAKALMAEHLQKKRSREVERAKPRPAAASTEAAEQVPAGKTAAVSADVPTAAPSPAPPLPEGLPPPKLAPLPPVPAMLAAPTCPQGLWPAQAPFQVPNGLATTSYPTAQHSATGCVFPAQQQWAQQGWGAAPGGQYAPGMPQY